jgi:beta-N-acetylhexosaminidase
MKTLAIGAVMLDVAGYELTIEEKEILQHPHVGAVILFARNYYDVPQVTALIQAIRRARRGDILLAVDQEGGRVQRMQNGFTRLPPAMAYQQKPALAQDAGWLMAMELLSVGVDFSFAPVLDVDCGVSDIIGNRSFAEDSQLASRLAGDFARGMRQAGMSATGKHFPGHGAIALDSHLTLPVDERDLAEIRAKDLVPFQQLIAEGLEAIMPAHVLYPQVDDQPAGFSSVWLQTILRQELGFNGVIFSDDLSMAGAAIAGDFPARARLAQQAGCDMLLVCNNPSAAIQVIDTLPQQDNAISSQRLQTMKAKQNVNRAELMASERWRNTAKQLAELIK